MSGVIEVRDGDWIIIGTPIDRADGEIVRTRKEAARQLGVNHRLTIAESNVVTVHVLRGVKK